MNRPRKSNLSVVVPSFDPGEDLDRCLESISRQTLDADVEIIVVDSSPKDPGPDIRSRFPGVRVVHLSKRTLPGKARSVGASQAKGEVVFFIDTDCVADPDWLERLWVLHESGYLAFGGSVVNGTSQNVVGTAEYLLEFNEINPWTKARDVRALPSCNLAVDRRIFPEVGFFPDFWKGEDTLFCEKIRLAGHPIRFEPSARITHMNRKSFVRYIKNQVALGEGSAEARRQASLHGQFLIRYPVLLPFVPIARTGLIANRLLRSNLKLLVQFAILYPLILLGMAAHVWGFIRGPHRSGLSTEKRNWRLEAT
jgi:GT2 family glycosyltransferase